MNFTKVHFSNKIRKRVLTNKIRKCIFLSKFTRLRSCCDDRASFCYGTIRPYRRYRSRSSHFGPSDNEYRTEHPHQDAKRCGSCGFLVSLLCCPVGLVDQTMLGHEELAAEPRCPRTLILRGGLVGNVKNPPRLHPDTTSTSSPLTKTKICSTLPLVHC